MSDGNDEMHKLIESYTNYLGESFEAIWNLIPIEADKLEAYSVIGALLSRQVTLSLEMMKSPGTWNGHSAPMFLRSMTDLQITLGWILEDIEERSRRYIMHGLGEAKLSMEHYKAEVELEPEGVYADQLREMSERHSQWINSQRREFFVEVNLGNWAKLDTFAMAREIGKESLYKFAYRPFSQATHNMWPHVSVYNTTHCENALHRFHLIPRLFNAKFEPDFMYRSCKYVHQTYELLINRFDLNFNGKMPLEWWGEFFSAEEEDSLNSDGGEGERENGVR